MSSTKQATVQCQQCLRVIRRVRVWPLTCACGAVYQSLDGLPIVADSPRPAAKQTTSGDVSCRHRGRLIELLTERQECGCGNEGVEVWHCAKFGETVLRRKVTRDGRKRVEAEHGFRGRYCVTCRDRVPDAKPADAIRWLTLADLQRDTRRLLELLPERIGGVAGVPRSGMLPASQIAIARSVPLYSIGADGLQPVGHGLRLKNQQHTGPIVVVDDSLNAGTAMAAVRQHAPDAAIFAAVYCRPDRTDRVDVHAVPLPMPHFFEWHFFGSSLVRRAAFDMDGVICQECPADQDTDDDRYIDWMQSVAPLWLPRPHQVKAIITARLEKYRPQTEAWLQRWGVRYERLVMGPWSTKAERSRHYNAGQYKGDAYRQSGATLFFESCPIQSKQIAKATGKTVICPTTGEVF